VAPGSTVLDVGCGYGCTALHLARHYQAQVTGITISPRQAEVARKMARREGVADRVTFAVADAERYRFQPAGYDLVWTMESSEHFADKPAYFGRVANVLRPGGKLLLAAWTGSMQHAPIARLAEAAVCSSLQTALEYTRQIEAAGMQVTSLEDLSKSVVKTWEICQSRARAASWLKPIVPQSAREFVGVIDLMLDCFATGLLSYTVLVAKKSNT
jgi:tocopherol O-methyltransferase